MNNAKDEPGFDDGTDSIIFAANVGYGSVVAEPTFRGDSIVSVHAGPSQLLDFTSGALVNFIELGGGLKR